VKNALEDGCVVPGAAAYEVAAHIALKKYLETVKGRARLGIQVFFSNLFFRLLTLVRIRTFD
jgi:T-complex protein 1 subunit zeta